jgi:3-methyladenine DNA glycosylase AlkD
MARLRISARVPVDVPALAREAHSRLEALARPAPDHPASGGYGSRLRRLGLRLPEVHAAARDLALACRAAPPRDVVGLAQRLVDGGTFEGGLVACDLLNRHRAGAAALGARDLTRLAGAFDNWGSVDTFCCLVSGPAWRRGQVSDALIARWARSKNRWWRRAALASTVPLNLKARGGDGDAPRTLRVCRLLVDDHDDLVAKAMSWALRVLAMREPAAVARFLARHRGGLAARVVREVSNKLATGRKNPRPAGD